MGGKSIYKYNSDDTDSMARMMENRMKAKSERAKSIKESKAKQPSKSKKK